MRITVVRVGEEMASALRGLGIGVVHSREVHDREGKLGAYVRSLPTAQRMLAENPTIRVLLDIHRDAQRRSETTIEFGGQTLARVMVVLGTDQSLSHPNWKENYAFALRLVRAMERRVAGLSSGIFPKMYRYNQHLRPGALLLEVGGVENSLEECLRTARVLARVLADMASRGELP